jgi:hypothetical protein
MKILKAVIYNYVPIILMILIIPIVKDDWILLGIFTLVSIVSLLIGHDKKELLVFLLGLIILTISESIFVSTGVEIFTRKTLFDIMPIWLPVLWGFSFVSIKRTLPHI